MPELLNCPFCGGEARKWQDPSHSAAWFIGCDDGDRDCFGSFHWAETEAEAIEAWNRRALPARGVGVRKLEWEESVKGRWIGTPVVKLGDLAFWIFQVDGGFRRAAQDGWQYCLTLDAAKAAAQADYEAHILAALAPTDAAQARAPFFFDRYINGVQMAEGVCIERETTLEGAMQAAVRIAAKGPKGEAPVLVYRAPTDAAHVNETSKSEHDGADVLTDAQAREAALEKAAAKATEHMDMHNGRDMNSYRAALGVRDAILALIQKGAAE